MCTKYEANNYIPVYISTGCFGLLVLWFFFSISVWDESCHYRFILVEMLMFVWSELFLCLCNPGFSATLSNNYLSSFAGWQKTSALFLISSCRQDKYNRHVVEGVTEQLKCPAWVSVSKGGKFSGIGLQGESSTKEGREKQVIKGSQL